MTGFHKQTLEELKQKCYEQESEETIDFYLVERIEEGGEPIVSSEVIKETANIEMKPLPAHLQYQFIDDEKKFPVIVSASLTDTELQGLLAVLK